MVLLDVQLSAAHCDWPTLRAASQRAEQAGFAALWNFDHLAGVALGGDRMLECFTWLGALAEATSRIELGVLVANVWNRQVGSLVAAAASVPAIAGRPFHFGLGAGTSPVSPWAAEQHAVAAHLEPSLDARHQRVEQVLDLTDRLWSLPRDGVEATFTLPRPVPSRIVGVNSVALSRLAGRRAEGVNVRWDHPRRDEFLEAAREAARDRPLITTAWAHWDADLPHRDHPLRVEARDLGLDRLVLMVEDPVSFRPAPVSPDTRPASDARGTG